METYRRALDTYGDGEVPLSQFAGNAFTAVINLEDVIDGLGPASVTPAGIAGDPTGVDVPSFMTDSYTCDQRLAFSPITCSGGRRVFEGRGWRADQPERPVVRRHGRRRPRLSTGALT